MAEGMPNLCIACEHLHTDTMEGVEEGKTPRCTAFPGRIPGEIWWQGRDHREPYPGDNGVRFQPDSESPGFAEKVIGQFEMFKDLSNREG